MIPSGFIADLLARVDIVDVIGRHVQLKKGGANLMGLCPFHGEKSPSFSVSPSKQFYYCFGCGASGDAVRFLTEHTGASFRDAVTDLAQQVGLTVPDDARSDDERRVAAQTKARQATLTEVLERAAQHFRTQLKGNTRAVDYLKGRGLSGEIAARFGLGYAPDGWHALASAFAQYDDPLLVESGLVIHQHEDDKEEKRYDRFRDRVMFPIRAVGGETIGFGGRVLDRGEPKYLNSPETPVFVKGRELYGLYESRAGIRARGHALVVEGYMDVVALAQSGFDNAVATLGTACTEEHLRKLFRFTDAVVFSFDGDAAGRRAANRALESALPHATDLRSIRFLFLPPEHDPDSFVRNEGVPAFERAVAQAVPLSRQIIDVARDQCDLGTPEGRARFVSQSRPLWSALPEGGLKRQMLSELNKTAGLPEGELATLWASAAPSMAAARTRPQRRPASGAPRRRLCRQPACAAQAGRPHRSPAADPAGVVGSADGRRPRTAACPAGAAWRAGRRGWNATSSSMGRDRGPPSEPRWRLTTPLLQRSLRCGWTTAKSSKPLSATCGCCSMAACSKPSKHDSASWPPRWPPTRRHCWNSGKPRQRVRQITQRMQDMRQSAAPP